MLKKVIETLKTTAIILVCILAPLLIAGKFMRTATKNDAELCLATFMRSEGIGLSKYIASQFENTSEEFYGIMAEMRSVDLNDAKAMERKLKTFLERDKNIAHIYVYDEKGKFYAGSSAASPNTELDIVEDVKDSNNEIIYRIDQEKNGGIVIRYAAEKKFNDDKKFFFELIMKWNRYENYMLQMQQGSFPRMFYIVSPDCKRYVSLNSLPEGAVNNRNVVALGMHLAQTIGNISFGLSTIEVESFNFITFKEEIKMPKGTKGSKFFIVVAADDAAVDTISENMISSIPFIIMMLVAVWLVACVIAAGFFTKTKIQLRISEAITDSTPLAIVIFKVSDGKIMKINSSATTLLRVEKENKETLNIWELFIEEDDRNYVKNAVSSSINVLNHEILLHSFGGATFWSICSANPIEVDEQKHVVLAILDINRRKEVEKKLANNAALLERQVLERTADLESKAKELEESNSELEDAKKIANAANSAKSKFLTTMSNELKTPINAIIGYSEILKEEALDRKDSVSADDLSKIIGSAKHLLSLINGILDLSKIESGKTQLFLEDINVVALVKDVEGVSMPLVANNNNSLFLEYPKDIGVMYSDSTKIRQCLLNLLSNAAKFTEFGKITLRIVSLVKEGEDFIEFAVIDTGVGIEASKIDSIFESFQDGDGKSSGSGLGLSLTKKYSEYLGGNISVESEIGGGSKFVVRLPRICKTKASEFVEIKTIKDEELAEEEMTNEVAPSGSSKSGGSWSV